MKLFGFDIGSQPPPEPSPRLLDQPISASVETPVATERSVEPFLQERIDHLVRVLDANIALAEKWERQLVQSQTEKYRYVELYETTKRELAAALRINAFREAQIASLRTRIATLEEPKLPEKLA